MSEQSSQSHEHLTDDELSGATGGLDVTYTKNTDRTVEVETTVRTFAGFEIDRKSTVTKDETKKSSSFDVKF